MTTENNVTSQDDNLNWDDVRNVIDSYPHFGELLSLARTCRVRATMAATITEVTATQEGKPKNAKSRT